MADEIIFSLTLSQLSHQSYLMHTGECGNQTGDLVHAKHALCQLSQSPIPKGLPPKPFQNHCLRSLASSKTLKKSGVALALRSWLIVTSFQGSAPLQASPTHQKSLRYDFRITMVRQLEMKRRKEEIILDKKP